MDWAELSLFFFILARMSGCVLFNPLLGRRGTPGMFKSGLILLLSVTAFTMTEDRPPAPDTILEMAVIVLLELALGYILGLAMNLFLYIPRLGGETIDMQMGMSMGKTYDPSSQTSVSMSAMLLNTLMTLLFFVANGHHTLMRIFLASGRIVPFGQVVLGRDLYWALIELFVECTVLAIKLCMPILAAELLGQISMGILMKVIPQINVFVINIDLKVIIGLVLELLLLAPFSEYLMGVEVKMLRTFQELVTMMAG